MALEQVRLAGGKRLEVNTYENCKQTAYRRLRKQSRVEMVIQRSFQEDQDHTENSVKSKDAFLMLADLVYLQT